MTTKKEDIAIYCVSLGELSEGAELFPVFGEKELAADLKQVETDLEANETLVVYRLVKEKVYKRVVSLVEIK